MLARFQHRLAALTGRRRALAAFSLGVCATLALPPLHLFPFLIPAFLGFYILIDSAATRRRAFWDGWWWGFGHFTTGLYWMSIAMMTDPQKFAWLIPFTLLGLNAVIALYTAAFALLVKCCAPKTPWTKVLVFALLWSLVEFARGHLLTGFPWNLIGYAWSFSVTVSQIASVIGVYGLGFLTVFLAVIPALALPPSCRAKVSIACAYLGFAFCIALGALRLAAAAAPENERFDPNVRLRIVQPNILQHHKWNPQKQMEGLTQLIRLSRQPSADGRPPTHIIWPETAIPYVLNLNPSLLNIIDAAIPHGATLLSGTLRAESDDPDSDIWNSLAIIRSQEPVRYFDKHHLVPFGEFVPLRGILPVDKITPGAKDFSRGPGVQTLSLEGAPSVSPLICYEAIFPHEVVHAGERPGWLLNITNDAWFGNSSGPYQHFAMARMRAIEEGIPLVRAANTGISAVIDAHGQIVAVQGLNQAGVLDAKIPLQTSTNTIYSCEISKYLPVAMTFVLILTLIYNRRRIIHK